MTATATDSAGSTSELSTCQTAEGDPQPGPTFTVNTTVDSPPGDVGCTTVDCTLREAIDEANTIAGANEIHFDIPGSGPHTIVPSSVLPKITDQLTIDGTTQPGWDGPPLIEIDGTTATNAGSVGPGLEISASNSVVRALAINDFLSGFGGIEIEAGTGSVVEASYIGTDVTGMLARPNSWGIEIVDTASDSVIGGSPEGRNVISGNAGTAVNIFGPATADTLVDSNFIGLDATGLGVLANGFYGVRIVNTRARTPSTRTSSAEISAAASSSAARLPRRPACSSSRATGSASTTQGTM